VAAAVAGELERTGLTAWPADLEVLPQEVERTSGDHVVRGYPALVDAGSSVQVSVFASVPEQREAMRLGLRRLLRLALSSPVKAAERSLSTRARLLLGANPDGSLADLLDDCADAAVDALMTDLVWSAADFEVLRSTIAGELVTETIAVAGLVERVLGAAHDVRSAMPERVPPVQAAAIVDIRAQFRRLLPSGFVAHTGRARLPDLARYLTAVTRRLEQLPRDPATDAARMARVEAVSAAYSDLVTALPPSRAAAGDVRAIGWQIEELRVSLWAQQLGTPRPVSEQRIYRAIDSIEP
jgi:ATP-dependent helicase HrpA